jgi:dihydropteroate synthase
MPFASRPSFAWRLRTRLLPLGERTLIMGILNVTPDSFSDGGHFYDAASAPERARDHALAMLDEGAEIIDVGGESTRPNATPLSPDEEQQRVLPVIEAILRERPGAMLSIDTFHAETACAAVKAGVEIVNDVSGMLWDRAMPSKCAELECGIVLMHARGRPQEWSSQPPLSRDEVMPVIHLGLSQSLAVATGNGVVRDRIVLDPGIGFGKRGEENYTILARFDELKSYSLPLLAGLSRKGFLGRTLAEAVSLSRGNRGTPPPPEARLNATVAGNVAAILGGAHIVRVHDVQAAAQAAAIADAILKQPQPIA